MQDAHTLQIGVPGHPDYCWFAVFDGHGGSLTSSHASKAVLSKVVATPEWQADSVSPESIGRAIVRGFLDIDEDLRKVRAATSGQLVKQCACVNVVASHHSVNEAKVNCETLKRIANCDAVSSSTI